MPITQNDLDWIDLHLASAVYYINAEHREKMAVFDTQKISKADLTKALDRGDVEAGTTERQTSWDGQILKVDWVSPPVTENTETKPMSITGLQSGAFKALLDEMKREIAAAQTQGIADVHAAKEDAATTIKTTISGVKAKIQSEVSDALQEFSEFTNGGPA